MSMFLRRNMLLTQSSGVDMGTAIYRKDNVPTTAFDTGIKIADTNKAYTILTELSFPQAYINGNTWAIGIRNALLYSLGSIVNVLSIVNPCGVQIGGNFLRFRFFDKATYSYANATNYPFLSSERKHRFAHWHEANTDTASFNFDGYRVLTTASGATYETSNDSLYVQAYDQVIVYHILIYNKTLTSEEINDYISNGIIP